MARLIPGHLKERLSSLPDRPGVYLFKDKSGRPVYIGKALSIRKRVMGHFRSYGETFSKEGVLLGQVDRIDVIETPTEAEALLLEASLVKEAMPKYNQELKDDKSYPYLKLTAEEYPRLLIARGRRADGGKYFGPYTNARLLRQAVRMLRTQFPLRTCRVLPKRVCLMYHLGQCGGPCEGLQEKTNYLETVRELELFLEGRRDALVRSLTRRMKEHSKNREYEKAQALFEEIRALAAVPSPSRKEPGEKVLADLKEALSLPAVPRRIECFDISNIQGSEAVGSMVVFIDAKPARSEYRKFRIRTVQGIDDYQMMREVIRRRYARAIEEKQALTDLVVIDGGKGHLSAAKKELNALKLESLPVISIAKQHEYIFTPDREAPHIFSPTSPFLHLIRHLRDEAHRFAITYHRRLHKKEALVSILDGIRGVGPVTRQRLMKRVGGAKKIAAMPEEELAEKAGIPPAAARRILEALRASGPVKKI
ncbi:MAG TPA: excinuclease ABC subunit UvrC [Candidatus Eisenbacteria bacterium]|nr:excinuclease ABC subunit UvrC [Candidatus Eisenbacteria bacterium]